MQCRSQFIPVGGLRLHYLDYGPEDGPVALCWHGMLQTGRSHAPLARHLAGRGWRVLAFDLPGHGGSDWSGQPGRDYALEAFAEFGRRAVAALGLERFSLIGTSLGGHVAMAMAAADPASRVDALVLNDVPMALPRAIADRVPMLVGQQSRFAFLDEADRHYRRVFAAGGTYDAALWPAYLESLVRPHEAGGYVVHHDPALRQQIEVNGHQNDRTADYDRLRLPTLLIHAGRSSVVDAAALASMRARGPRPRVLELPDLGHPPCWSTPGLAEAVAAFLDQSVSDTDGA